MVSDGGQKDGEAAWDRIRWRGSRGRGQQLGGGQDHGGWDRGWSHSGQGQVWTGGGSLQVPMSPVRGGRLTTTAMTIGLYTVPGQGGHPGEGAQGGAWAGDRRVVRHRLMQQTGARSNQLLAQEQQQEAGQYLADDQH